MKTELVVWREQVLGCADLQLMAELQRLVRVDRRCEARMLVCLAELDARRSFLEHGYSSLFRYATSALRMSDAQAYLRIQAARVARSYPVVLDMLEQGALNLSTLKLLAPHLTAGNHVALLERARDKTKRDVELLVAEVAPLPDVPNRIRKLPTPAAGRALNTECAPTSASTVNIATTAESCVVPPPAAPAQAQSGTPVSREAEDVSRPASAAKAFALEAPRASCTPLRPGRFRLQLTGSQELHDKLKQLQHLLQHQIPGADIDVIVERAFDLLLEKLLKQRFAQLSKPRSASEEPRVTSADGGEPGYVQAISTPAGAGAQHSGAELASRPSTRTGAGAQQSGAEVASRPSTRTGAGAQQSGAEVSSRPSTRTGAGAQQSGAELARPPGAGSSKPCSTSNSRYIPRAVVREVFARDGGQCTFVSASGLRCVERGMLELHHVRAFALGGEATVDNLKLVCRSHNGFFAAQDFGAEHMKRALSGRRSVQGAGGAKTQGATT